MHLFHGYLHCIPPYNHHLVLLYLCCLPHHCMILASGDHTGNKTTENWHWWHTKWCCSCPRVYWQRITLSSHVSLPINMAQKVRNTSQLPWQQWDIFCVLVGCKRGQWTKSSEVMPFLPTHLCPTMYIREVRCFPSTQMSKEQHSVMWGPTFSGTTQTKVYPLSDKLFIKCILSFPSLYDPNAAYNSAKYAPTNWSFGS